MILTKQQRLSFWLRSHGLRARQILRFSFWNLPRFIPQKSNGEFSEILSESRSPLWSQNSPAEYTLSLGKVQNLRIALHRLNGLKIPAGEVFSFWRHLGRPTRHKGYVAGRELREGCLLPVIGGGICQLSNALFEIASLADFEIVERHRHTQIIPGSLAEQGKDATVFWNYVDFKFRPKQEIYLSAFLSQDELVLQFKAKPKTQIVKTQVSPSFVNSEKPTINLADHSCGHCAQVSCSLNQKALPLIGPKTLTQTRTAWLLDECWPEYQDYLAENKKSEDVLAIPIHGTSWPFKGYDKRYNWKTEGFHRVITAPLLTMHRSWISRRLAQQGGKRVAVQLEFARNYTKRIAKHLKYDVTHVVTTQTLLPFLWEAGLLGGRTFDVLMTGYPLFELQRRLDQAKIDYPESLTLADFRASTEILQAESEALNAARKIVTPHPKIAELFPEKVERLLWKSPKKISFTDTKFREDIFYLGPTLGRKGCYALREVVKSLSLNPKFSLKTVGATLEALDFWKDLPVQPAPADWWNYAKVVVQPALIENQPRQLLVALAHGIPVITTTDVGLEDNSLVQTVPFGDKVKLADLLQAYL